MDASEYQKATMDTAIYPPEKALEYLALGLVSEAGEVAGIIKKIIRGDDNIDFGTYDAMKELGDVLWYVAQLCDLFNLDMGVVMRGNIEKLEDRKLRGVIKGSGDDR